MSGLRGRLWFHEYKGGSQAGDQGVAGSDHKVVRREEKNFTLK